MGISQHIIIILFIHQIILKDVICNKCILRATCGSCIAESPLCAWCSAEEFSGSRCDLKKNLEGKCNKSSIADPDGSMKIIKDNILSDKGAKEGEATQIKPQEIKIKLRANDATKFIVEFRQAVDYPIDLYYLMDLSHSMKDDKEKLALLGNKLAKEMKTITTNFKLGFGSFVDKTVSPFVNSNPNVLNEPCPGCATPYGFHNNMPLSSKTHEFARKVQDAPISGNLDPPEGGFDAIMQAILCKNEVGWRNESRKLLVYSTDNGFHSAGDGKLGGIMTPHDEKCHLDKDGYYTMNNILDYPSVGQISRQVKENKINVIFAVTRSHVQLYEALSKRLVGSSTGKLENDSSNVVDLVRKQYDEISSELIMDDDNTDSNVRISYFSSCLGNTIDKTNNCKGLKVGTKVTFEVEIEFKFCPEDVASRNRTIHIFPVGLSEQLTVHLEMMCDCECEKPWKEEALSPKCTEGNGTFECGICDCNEKRYGSKCECDTTVTDPFLEVEGCKKENDEYPCSKEGTCQCGLCKCNLRDNPKEIISGKYCECKNYNCETRNGKMCNGEDHGECDCGVCKCLPGWTGSDCGCKDAPEKCIGPDKTVCSGRGVCECGSCKCNSEGEYFGTYCNDCSTCPGKCEELRECVECFIEHKEVSPTTCSMCPVNVIPFEKIEAKEKEKQCIFKDKNKCQFTFKYAFSEDNQLRLWTKMRKECPEPVDIIAIVAGVSGGVVATGLFLLMLWKILTVVHDRRELAKFEKERLMAKWNQGQNPLYKEVEMTYQNPAYSGGGTASLGTDEVNG